jgi:hypothetical protein
MTTQFAELIETVVDGKPAALGSRETLCSLLGLAANATMPLDELVAAARKRIAALEEDVFSDRIELRTLSLAVRLACDSEYASLAA